MAICNRPIEEYAIIGDCVTAALINADGGIDWLCLPAFDGPSFFGALLDGEKGGDFTIHPTVPYKVTRRYAGAGAIFETRFVTAEGVITLTDFFVLARIAEARWHDFAKLHPTRKLVRIIEVEGEGNVPMSMAVCARPNYGAGQPGWIQLSPGSFTCDQTSFSTNTPVVWPALDLHAAWTASAGQCYFAVLDYGAERPIPSVKHIQRWRRVTVKYWQHWGEFNDYRGIHQEVVRRSAITLKLLTYAPTGVFVAAPTTSLPEIAGGSANWDYRFSWVRDTSFFINTFSSIGYSGEAMAFLKFVIADSMRRHGKKGEIVPVFYGIREESQIEEIELKHLGGYLDSRPVRAGNRAASQFQLDNYADILEAFFFYKHIGGHIGKDEMTLVREVAEQLLQRWRAPDNGLWEEEEKKQLTYGKVATWSGLMRAATLSDLKDLNIEQSCAEIHREVMSRTLQGPPGEQHMVSRFDSNDVDAACLLTFLSGFSELPIARRTREKIEEELAEGPFLHRNPTGKQKGEGAFFLCMFWRIDHLVKEGEVARAEELLDQVLALKSPFGLLSEQIDPRSRAFRGNFPQAFSHLGLIDSILNVNQAKKKPEMATLTDHEKFVQTVGRTMGLRGRILGFMRNPKTLGLLLHDGESKWKG